MQWFCSYTQQVCLHTKQHTHRGAGGVCVCVCERARTHRHHHGVLSVKFRDVFVSAAPLRLVQRPEATHHLHPAHATFRRLHHREEAPTRTRKHTQPGRFGSGSGPHGPLRGCDLRSVLLHQEAEGSTSHRSTLDHRKEPWDMKSSFTSSVNMISFGLKPNGSYLTHDVLGSLRLHRLDFFPENQN